MSNAPIEKIKKLLNLAENNSNENEAAAALAQANALMAKYGIDKLDRREPSKAIKDDTIEFNKPWHYMAGMAASHLFGCYCVNLTGTGTFYFLGRAENNAASRAIYEYITKQIEQFYKQALPQGMSKQERSKYRRHFKDSAARRVFQRAAAIVDKRKKDDAEAKKSTGSSALVVAGYFDQLAAENQKASEDLGLKSGRSRARNRSMSQADLDGASAGNRVNLTNGIDNKPPAGLLS